MDVDVTQLFAPLTIGSRQLPNRIVLPPMLTLLDLAAPEGRAWYGERARGGAARAW